MSLIIPQKLIGLMDFLKIVIMRSRVPSEHFEERISTESSEITSESDEPTGRRLTFGTK